MESGTRPTPTPTPTPLALVSPRRLLALLVDGLLFVVLVAELYPYASFALIVYFWLGMRFRTLGHRVAGLAVVTPDGGPVGLRALFTRSLPWQMLLVAGLFPLWGSAFAALLVIVTLLAELVSRLVGFRGGVGDLMAGTRTVRRRDPALVAV